ncbi:MAG: FAD-binding oxidoreductase [Bradyrhizobiaceae bacterium]|nr:FAD-binding oxidoreductase [Bradyrhizobiaceae bacterium]
MTRTLTSVFPPDKVSSRWLDRLVLSRDASLYRLVPKDIVRPSTVADIQQLFAYCREHKRHLTFRAGGTSLSGQAVGDDILVDLSKNWERHLILDNGAAIFLEPGVTGGRANALLHRHGRKIGPDPASISAAMIGGIIANNSSGMCCGVANNAYHTLTSLQVVLADGTYIDTSTADADDVLHSTNPEMYSAIAQLRDAIRNNASLTDRIRTKYLIKNTMGYSINAFLDEDEPVRIIARLMVGSEGTLGFVAGATFATVPDAKNKWTQLQTFPSVEQACEAASVWRDHGAAAIELMDDASLQSFASLRHTPDRYRITAPGAAALLVEFHHHEPPVDGAWVQTPAEQAVLWKLRKGLMPSIGASRTSGETMINEDIAVHPDKLASLVSDVKGAFHSHGYQKAIVFGHAKDGNIHFVLNQAFSTTADLDRYDRFMHSIAEIVLDKHDGSLKAEHGTGRNMAPFLEKEWGSELTEVMWKVKETLDPHGILNPGVLLNRDQNIHLKNIKPVPTVDAEVDRCIECGFCEHVCPTRYATLTPRQRIVLRREKLLPENAALLAELTEAEDYSSVESCAVDGICGTACPVDIDTGLLVKRLRSERQPKLLDTAAVIAADHYRPVQRLAGAAMSLMLPIRQHHHLGVEAPVQQASMQRMVYLQTCPSRWFDREGRNMDVLAKAAGIELVRPPNPNAVCCGQPFESKGLTRAHEVMVEGLTEALGTMGEERTIVADTNTCAAALVEHLTKQGWKVYSPVEWIASMVLPRCDVQPLPLTLAVHPGCGSAKLHEQELMLAVAKSLVNQAFIPSTSSCCGMAGAHGIQHPAVPQTALNPMKVELSEHPVDVVLTSNTLCACAIEKYARVPSVTITELAATVITNGRLDLSSGRSFA